MSNQQKRSRYFGLEREIHVLRNVAGEPGDECGVKFSGNNSNEVTACIKQRSTAVAGLHGCADLKIARVIAKPRERAYIPN